MAGLGVLKSRNFDRSYLGTGGGDGSYANRLWVRVRFEGQGSTRVICHLGFPCIVSCLRDDVTSCWWCMACKGSAGQESPLFEKLAL